MSSTKALLLSTLLVTGLAATTSTVPKPSVDVKSKAPGSAPVKACPARKPGSQSSKLPASLPKSSSVQLSSSSKPMLARDTDQSAPVPDNNFATTEIFSSLSTYPSVSETRSTSFPEYVTAGTISPSNLRNRDTTLKKVVRRTANSAAVPEIASEGLPVGPIHYTPAGASFKEVSMPVSDTPQAETALNPGVVGGETAASDLTTSSIAAPSIGAMVTGTGLYRQASASAFGLGSLYAANGTDPDAKFPVPTGALANPLDVDPVAETPASLPSFSIDAANEPPQIEAESETAYPGSKNGGLNPTYPTFRVGTFERVPEASKGAEQPATLTRRTPLETVASEYAPSDAESSARFRDWSSGAIPTLTKAHLEPHLIHLNLPFAKRSPWKPFGNKKTSSAVAGKSTFSSKIMPVSAPIPTTSSRGMFGAAKSWLHRSKSAAISGSIYSTKSAHPSYPTMGAVSSPAFPQHGAYPTGSESDKTYESNTGHGNVILNTPVSSPQNSDAYGNGQQGDAGQSIPADSQHSGGQYENSQQSTENIPNGNTQGHVEEPSSLVAENQNSGTRPSDTINQNLPNDNYETQPGTTTEGYGQAGQTSPDQGTAPVQQDSVNALSHSKFVREISNNYGLDSNGNEDF